jgi:DNA-binding response OmpR family regulator
LTQSIVGAGLLEFAPAQGSRRAYPRRGQCVLPFGLKSTLAKLHFLVADERDMLSLLIPYLRDMGVETIHRATDGPEALKILRQSRTRVDIVICDWDLPKLSGLEVLKFVRDKYGAKPFLMLASQVTRAAIATAAKHGVNGYLAKPFTVRLLENRVVNLVRALPHESPGKPETPQTNDGGDDESWDI